MTAATQQTLLILLIAIGFIFCVLVGLWIRALRRKEDNRSIYQLNSPEDFQF